MEPLSIFQLSVPRGEFYEPPPSSEHILSPGYQIRPKFISMVREKSFSGLGQENPYHHLREFEQLCSCLKIRGMKQEVVQWRLFPFSLHERAKQWYTSTVECVNGNWEKLRDRFCLAFFAVTRITTLRVEILSFRESAFYLDITAGGSFMHKTPAEGKEILDRISENTSFVGQCVEPHPEAFVSGSEEPSFAKPETEPSTCSGLTKESSLKPSPDSKDIQAPGCAPIFRDDPHSDYEKT
uniref:Athila retroelement ORF1 protein n=2 Tax=Oryza sativa subsp. japonica TaxID=39947 RepID=A0A5S6R8U3_ORYSJ|nr:Putative Athila retroelement ORF1 protein [Oryza sativa]AAM01183.1 Hypothetical protein similar to putative retroelements [Oryza sativa Japonica Group]AAP52398.1 hypothetical protein LOC_Os10g09640 [Oryza sativa Japonica Group]